MKGMIITMAFGAFGNDEPAKEDDAVTRYAGADTTKHSGIMLDTAWRGDTVINS